MGFLGAYEKPKLQLRRKLAFQSGEVETLNRAKEIIQKRKHGIGEHVRIH